MATVFNSYVTTSHEGWRPPTPFMAFFVSMTGSAPNFRTVAFWDAQAPWQQAWLAHCPYHRDIIPLVLAPTLPGWRVLDIGAGSGILALPLHQRGCRVTALEPSRGMRTLLHQTLQENPPAHFDIDHRTWEQVPLSSYRGYDLMVACNSLHVTSWGFSRALAKIFRAAPRHVCVISENRFFNGPPRPYVGKFYLRWQRQLTADSSVAYHSLAEVWEHFHCHWGRPPTAAEQAALAQELTYQGEHFWLKQQTRLTICWWSRRGGSKRTENNARRTAPH